MPKVSVILPAYNAEKYINEAVDSILAQTFRDFELIVINDCSRDRTEELLLAYTDPRLVYLKNEVNLGVAGTLNKGLSVAKGEYIARMDADDISLPQRFEMQVAYLDAHPDTAVLGTALERFGEGIPSQIRRFSAAPAAMKADLLFACGLAHPSVMMRRQVVADLGGYDRAYEGLEDYELWCRVAREHAVTALDTVLLRYRVHPQQVTKNPSEKYITRLRSLKAVQLQQLALPVEGELAEQFYNFCLGQRPREGEEILALGRLLEQLAAGNAKTRYYDAEILSSMLRSVLLGYVSKLQRREVKLLLQNSVLLSRSQVVRRRGKDRIKKLLGRT